MLLTLTRRMCLLIKAASHTAKQATQITIVAIRPFQVASPCDLLPCAHIIELVQKFIDINAQLLQAMQ